MNALDIQGLTKIYKGKRGAKVSALMNLDLSISAGEVFGFLGPNGAGKSTTIKSIMGLISPTAGTAKIFGQPATNPAARQKVGYLPENPSLYEFLTGREFLHFIGKSFAMDSHVQAEETRRVLDLLDLAAAADRPIRSYSKGMVQRLGLAQALLHDPDLYILDEPMSGLDPIGRALVKEIIQELKGRGKTVFFSTHITSDVEVVCDRVGIIVGGILRVTDNVESIMKSGIEGYHVQVSTPSTDLSLFAGYTVMEKSSGVLELYLPRQEFQAAMERINRAGCTVDLVEPKRKGLEAFFLEIVAKDTACN